MSEKKKEPKVKRKYLRRAKRIPVTEFDPNDVQIVVVASLLEILEDDVEREYEANRNESLRGIYRLLSKFETFRSILFFILFVTFFFQRPQWCQNRVGISSDCNKDDKGKIYYVSQLLALPPFVNKYNHALSWIIMLLLIAPDIIIVLFIGDMKYKCRVISMAILIVLDIVFSIFTGVLNFWIFKYDIAPFFKIVFMILYNNSMRNSMKRLFFTLKGAYEAILVFLLNLLIWSGFAFILFHEFFDVEKYYDYKFTSYLGSVFSMYVLQTKVNHPNLFLGEYDKANWVPLFFMLFTFFTIFLILNIIVSIFYITYKKHYALIIPELGSYARASRADYSRIVAAATNKDGLISHGYAKKMTREYLLKGPEFLDFIIAKHLQKISEAKQESEYLAEGVREVGYNMKHRPYFKAIYKSRVYRWFWCCISLYVFLAPVFILEDPMDKWTLTHYNLVEYASLALLIDPILVLVFMGTKKFKRNKFYIIEIFSSIGLIALSVASDFLVPKAPLSLERTNYNFFLIYSSLCFSKAGRLFTTVLKELPQTKAVIGVLSCIGPFLAELMGMLVNIFLIFGQIGINLFGGNINSDTPNKYFKIRKKRLPPRYEQMNFNDFPNSMVFLWNIFMNNNWLDMAYMALINFKEKYKRFDRWAKWYFVIFYIFTAFLVMNIITGFIIEVILSHLNRKYVHYFKLSEEAIKNIRNADEYSDTTTSEEEDENAFVDDEAVMDLEARIRQIMEELNKGLASNLRTFGLEDRKHQDESKELEDIRLI